MRRALSIGISTCPNDTFAFAALMRGDVRIPGVELAFELCDVEELNRGLANGRFDAAKASFALALELTRETWVLRSGAALGRGVGPVVLAPGSPAGARKAQGAPIRVLCPGQHTTATLLWRLFHAEPVDLQQTVFHRIMPALERGEADLGVCIHEGRFTYAARGLRLVEDLGSTWERATGRDLPLGGILARRGLGSALAGELSHAIERSIDAAHADPAAALPIMRAHAAELDERALWQHVETYVNAATRRMDAPGEAALAELARRARHAGLASRDAPDPQLVPDG